MMVTKAPPARLTSALDVPALPLEFVWSPYIATGKVTVVVDATSATTSVLTAYVAAVASAGATFPLCHQRCDPTTTIVIASQRALKNSIRSQLDVFRADLTKVKFLRDVDGKLGIGKFSPAEHGDQLEAAMLETAADLVATEMPFKIVAGDSKDIFSRLARDARRMETAIVVVVPAKKHTPQEIDGAVRSLVQMRSVAALCVVRCHRPSERILFESEKSITGHDIPALSFQLKPTTTLYDMPAVHLTWDSQPVQISVSVEAECKKTNKIRVPADYIDHKTADAEPRQSAAMPARRVAPHSRPSRARKAVKLETAMAFLRQILADGPVPTSELKNLAEKADIALITLRRAADRLPLVKSRRGWRLPT